MNRELAIRVFALFNDGLSAYVIEQRGVTSARTAQRLKKVWDASLSGQSSGEIRVNEWNEARIRLLLRWLSEYRVEASRQIHPAGHATLDQDARGTHLSQIRDVAQRLSQELSDDEEDVAQYGGPVIQVGYEAASESQITRLDSENGIRYEAFASHAESDTPLWEALTNFKAQLDIKVSQAINDSSLAMGWPSDVRDLTNIPTRGRVLVEKPISYRDLLRELARFLLTGHVPGTCQYCPRPS